MLSWLDGLSTTNRGHVLLAAVADDANLRLTLEAKLSLIAATAPLIDLYRGVINLGYGQSYAAIALITAPQTAAALGMELREEFHLACCGMRPDL